DALMRRPRIHRPWPHLQRITARRLPTLPTARPSIRSSPTTSRRPCASFGGRTVALNLAPALAVLLGACGSAIGPPAHAAPRIDYVDGAIEPILERGGTAVIEGFGFGAAQATGGVTF